MKDTQTDILFITPSFAPVFNEESTGTLILANILKRKGFNIDIFRFWETPEFKLNNYNGFLTNIVNQILKIRPRIVSFYCRCTDFHISLNIAEKLKEVNKDIIIVFGGPQAELVARDLLINFPYLDFIACSEGENTIIPLAEAILLASVPKNKVAGLCYRNEKGKIETNPLPELMPTNYSSNYYYYDLIPYAIVKNSKSLTLDVGRGCPYSCSFCSTKTFWKQKFRLRNIDDILDEMQWVVYNLGITKFDLDHDMFTANKKKLYEFCSKIDQRGLKVKWYCSSRIDTITEEDIDKLVNSGMSNILFGVETGSERMQQLINKNLKFQDCRKIIRSAVEKGVKTKVSFIYGFPEETEEDFEKTLKLMFDFLRLGAKVIVWRCGILNGTALYENSKDKLYFDRKNVCNYSFFGVKENLDMISQHKEIFPQFYDYPNPLRIELKYFDLFFNIWENNALYEFNKIAEHYLECRLKLLDMYRDFVKINKPILMELFPSSLDSLWNLSTDLVSVLIRRFLNERKDFNSI